MEIRNCIFSERAEKNTSTVLTHTVKRIRPTYILGIRICAGIISGCRQYDEIETGTVMVVVVV